MDDITNVPVFHYKIQEDESLHSILLNFKNDKRFWLPETAVRRVFFTKISLIF
jgi:hypothetical protein